MAPCIGKLCQSKQGDQPCIDREIYRVHPRVKEQYNTIHINKTIDLLVKREHEHKSVIRDSVAACLTKYAIGGGVRSNIRQLG
jgi:hypothetical protein